MEIQACIESVYYNKQGRRMLIISSRNSYSGFDECHNGSAILSPGTAVWVSCPPPCSPQSSRKLLDRRTYRISLAGMLVSNIICLSDAKYAQLKIIIHPQVTILHLKAFISPSCHNHHYFIGFYVRHNLIVSKNMRSNKG